MNHLIIIGTGHQEVYLRDGRGRRNDLFKEQYYGGIGFLKDCLEAMNDAESAHADNPLNIQLYDLNLNQETKYYFLEEREEAFYRSRFAGQEEDLKQDGVFDIKEDHEINLLIIKGDIQLKWIDKIYTLLSKNPQSPIIWHYQPGCQVLCKMLKEQFNDRLLIIAEAECLRSGGHWIQEGLSWDLSFRDAIQFYDSPNNSFASANNLMISFDGKAMMHFSKSEDNNICSEAYYYPDAIEQDNPSPHEDKKQNLFLAAFGSCLMSLLKNAETETPLNLSYCIHRGMAFVRQAEKDLEESYTRDEFFQKCKNYNAQDKCVEFPVRFMWRKSNEDLSRNAIAERIFMENKALIALHACQWVVHGNTGLMDSIPYCRYGSLQSFDRDEIASYRIIDQQIQQYIQSPDVHKPFSMAVFGPPGSGKSFGIKQLLKSICKNTAIIERNISQFENYQDLIKVFQDARDANLMGKLPVVIFDEFDSKLQNQKLGWLKYFLAPMQDAEFKDGELSHPLGRGIYIFAGGTCNSYKEFCEPVQYPAIKEEYKDVKLPDFISRLKAQMDVKGINQINDKDLLYPLRRAKILRSLLLQYKNISSDQMIRIDPSVLYALISIPKFKHGARSLEMILQTSLLKDCSTFEKSHLVAEPILDMAVDAQTFYDLMKENKLLIDKVDELARKIHQQYLDDTKESEANKINRVAWEQLNEEIKESNRLQAMDMIHKLQFFHLDIIPYQEEECIESFDSSLVEKMAMVEHDRWVREKKSLGWTFSKSRDNNKKFHPCLVEWEDLSEEEREKDRSAVRNIPNLLKSIGLGVALNANGL